MSNYSEYFFKSKSSIVQLETLEISHSNFTKTYYVVRNAVNGFTAKIENDDVIDFEYYPLTIENAGIKDDLDQTVTINLGDLGQVLPLELDAVLTAPVDNGFAEKPSVIYRVYRSDDSENILFGPVVLEIVNIAFNKEGCTFEAKAPSLNINKTGEVYNIDRFPMLRGFL